MSTMAHAPRALRGTRERRTPQGRAAHSFRMVVVGQCTAFHAATAPSQVDLVVTMRVSGHLACHDAASGNAPEPSQTIVLFAHDTL